MSLELEAHDRDGVSREVINITARSIEVVLLLLIGLKGFYLPAYSSSFTVSTLPVHLTSEKGSFRATHPLTPSLPPSLPASLTPPAGPSKLLIKIPAKDGQIDTQRTSQTKQRNSSTNQTRQTRQTHQTHPGSTSHVRPRGDDPAPRHHRRRRRRRPAAGPAPAQDRRALPPLRARRGPHHARRRLGPDAALVAAGAAVPAAGGPRRPAAGRLRRPRRRRAGRGLGVPLLRPRHRRAEGRQPAGAREPADQGDAGEAAAVARDGRGCSVGEELHQVRGEGGLGRRLVRRRLVGGRPRARGMRRRPVSSPAADVPGPARGTPDPSPDARPQGGPVAGAGGADSEAGPFLPARGVVSRRYVSLSQHARRPRQQRREHGGIQLPDVHLVAGPPGVPGQGGADGLPADERRQDRAHQDVRRGLVGAVSRARARHPRRHGREAPRPLRLRTAQGTEVQGARGVDGRRLPRHGDV
ncbi:hypothetical protein CTA1_10183 [Colletotrichum tanaceti]|uniref:Uncharacterized protein n=1 Tax=Colletotrichum tanaceti TaxID=1306861 RepID=A0A4U6X4C9_9PEZI|nr:hypothetical protein CTA1_10183 [Colletotrichum tanaceti]